MFRHVYPFLRIAILVSAIATPAIAADATPPAAMPLTAPGEAGFIAKVQSAVAKKDEAWLAGHTNFPMFWNKDAKAIKIKTRDQFAERFENLLTPEFQSAIAGQDPAKAFSNWQGTMIGTGGRNIWFRKLGEDYRIITINDDSRVDPNAKPM
ncbi:MAG TPA: hypothetical protein VMS78_01140 [Rhizomicrobium sp.]|nr:hypothetical protein [Rhizomicrobium sp.]